jgi:hypothetical protein
VLVDPGPAGTVGRVRFYDWGQRGRPPVGGPDLGWVKTSTLEETCKPALRRDVTVQAAMAVSGAAIASAMGRHAAAMRRLLALSNVRLGTWLPNPAFLAELGRPGAGCCCAPTAATGRTSAWSSCSATAVAPSTAVCVADVEYPEAFAVTPLERPSRHGTLVVAKALLTRTCRTSCSPTP